MFKTISLYYFWVSKRQTRSICRSCWEVFNDIILGGWWSPAFPEILGLILIHNFSAHIGSRGVILTSVDAGSIEEVNFRKCSWSAPPWIFGEFCFPNFRLFSVEKVQRTNSRNCPSLLSLNFANWQIRHCSCWLWKNIGGQRQYLACLPPWSDPLFWRIMV